MSMSLAVVQILVTTLACAGLWYQWKSIARGDRRAAAIVSAGFVLRAVIAQALFWISWLHLPVARSLQIGDGFWFFAIDGQGYLAYAQQLLGGGLAGVAFAT